MANLIKWNVDTTTKVTIFAGTATNATNDIANMTADKAALSATQENTDGSQYAMFELRVKPQASPTSGYFNLWLVRSLNGSDFEDATGATSGGTPVVPARPADMTIPVRATTDQQVCVTPIMLLPPQDFKVFVENKLATTTSNSTVNENQLFMLTFNDEVQ